MQRGDVTVTAISGVLTVVVAVAVAYSVLFLDRGSSALLSQSANSSWLVLTWSPSFCKAQPTNPGCTSGEVQGKGQTLVLHGLWPQPRENEYCGVPQDVIDQSSKGRGDPPPLDMSGGLRASLHAQMIDATASAPHEWYAHGTCSGVTQEVFFGDALTLSDEVRRVLDPVFRDAAGNDLALSTVRGHIDAAFGAGAGDRVGLGCLNAKGEGAYIVDVRLSVPPVASLRAVDDSLSLGRLLAEAPPMTSECHHGHVP